MTVTPQSAMPQRPKQDQRATQVLPHIDPPPDRAAAPRPPRQTVQVIVDACCELAPDLVKKLGILVLPRAARVDGRLVTLGPDQTLHHSCWAQLPRHVAAEPQALDELAQAYERVLASGAHVLALRLPGRLDSTTHTALAARNILLAGQRGVADTAPRIAVYEAAAIGSGFAFLAQVAARGAMVGMSLQQLQTLLDSLQKVQRSYYLTGRRGPIRSARQIERRAGAGWFGREQLWEQSRTDGLLACRARGWNLAQTLFTAQGPLSNIKPTIVGSQHPRLFERINQGRALAHLPPLTAQPGGLSLTALFPYGCVELTTLPGAAHVAQMIDVILRIDSPPAPLVRGVLARGGF